MSEARLKTALEQLQALPVDPAAKKAIAATLKAAANPNSESIDVVFRTLPKDRQALIEKTAAGLRAVSNGVAARGSQRLMEMSEDEWQRLINEPTD